MAAILTNGVLKLRTASIFQPLLAPHTTADPPASPATATPAASHHLNQAPEPEAVTACITAPANSSLPAPRPVPRYPPRYRHHLNPNPRPTTLVGFRYSRFRYNLLNRFRYGFRYSRSPR